jgi:Domain of unknown function (DUF4286)
MNQNRPALLLVGASVPESIERDFNRWYDEEHVPTLLRCPGFLSARRFVSSADGRHYLAAYDLSSIEALETDEYLAQRALPLSSLAAKVLPQRTARRREVYVKL